MKKKTYLYRPETSATIYSNLKSAVVDAYDDMRAIHGGKVSSPYLVKEQGGYGVLMFTNEDHIPYRTHIDVFTARDKQLSDIKNIKIHKIRIDKDGGEYDNECDYCCDECDNVDCEDRWLCDEDEE